MKKKIISLLALMSLFVSTSFSQQYDDVETVQMTSSDDNVIEGESVKDTLKTVVDTVKKEIAEIEKPLLAADSIVVDSLAADSAAADTTDPYIPFSDGLFLRPEIGGGLMTASNLVDKSGNYDFSVGIDMGYQFNPNLSVGWGVSFFMNSMKYDGLEELLALWSPESIDNYKDMNYLLPIYCMVRYKLFQKKLTPFVDGRLGYVVGLSKYELKVEPADPGIATENNGLYLELNFGVQIKNLSVSLQVNRLGSKDVDPDFREWCGLEKTDYHNSFIGLKVGYDFNLSKDVVVESEQIPVPAGVPENGSYY